MINFINYPKYQQVTTVKTITATNSNGIKTSNTSSPYCSSIYNSGISFQGKIPHLKPEVPKILGDNPLLRIKELVAQSTNCRGKDAKVFTIPEHPEYVLRVEKTLLNKLDSINGEYKLIPIHHSEKTLKQDNLGIPLYSIVSKDSPLFEREVLTPIEALKQPDNVMILRKVNGQSPIRSTFHVLEKLHGIDVDGQDVSRTLDLRQFVEIVRSYGVKNGEKCLDKLRKGESSFFKAGELGENSVPCTFNKPAEFVKDYDEYVRTYLNELKEISELPTESYKKAVDTILMDKNFIMDFQHTNNTFVDIPNKKFNFMDFEYDKTNDKYIYSNPVKEFRNVLLGKNFSKYIKRPFSLLVREKDIKQFGEYFDKITEKVNSVTPKKFKMHDRIDISSSKISIVE